MIGSAGLPEGSLCQHVKEHRRLISTMQRYDNIETKIPYAVGTRRGYGLL